MSDGGTNGYLAAFDLDGTLVDSWRDIALAVQITLEDRGLEPLDPRWIRQRIGLPASALFEDVAPVEMISALVTQFRANLLEVLGTHSVPYPGVFEGLEKFLGQGWTCAVATNKPKQLAELALREAGLDDYFQIVVGADAPLMPKPSADIPRECLHRSGCKGGILVGDTESDIRAAEAAGLVSVLIRYEEGGFRQITHTKSDHIVGSIEEVLGLEMRL